MTSEASTNPCDGASSWPKAPKPSHDPLAKMEWANGKSKDKFGCTRNSGKRFHAGIDLKAAEGTKCFAVEDAEVTSVKSGTALGKWVAIKFEKDGKTYGVAYCHLSKQLVKEKEKVKAGTVIGETGVSGNVGDDEPHLHLEIQDQEWRTYSSATERSKHAIDANSYME